ncbi:MAG TPA: phosphoribosyltransferase family protein [Thermoanaerobaculia bacterium]
MLTALSILGRETARIVLHASCVVCERELPWRARKASCCASCWSALPAITGAKCDSCAMPWSAGGDAFRCLACLENPLPVGWSDAWGHYRGSLERLLHAFKFERHDFLDDPLSELLQDVVRDGDFDAIVPVPMRRAKLRQRGYNQAELLGRALARRLRIRCEPSLLQKRIDRSPQSTLPRNERAANVRGAFVASPRVGGRAVLLVDDVCTTAETLRACANTLVAAKAARVCAVVVARA